MERKSHALLVFHCPLARRCRVEFIGPGPYLRVDQAEHRLGLAVDGDHRMDEKSSRYVLACWPKTSVTLRATGLLDLVMSCGVTNPTSLTGSWRVLRQRPNYLATRDGLRDTDGSQSPARRCRRVEDNQRAGLHQPPTRTAISLLDSRPRRRSPHEEMCRTIDREYHSRDDPSDHSTRRDMPMSTWATCC